MPRPQKNPPRRQWLDRMSWAAGVFDACVQVHIKESRGLPIGVEIKATFKNKAVRDVFVEALGGRALGGSRWSLPASEQLGVLRRVVPYLQDPVKVHKCNQVIAFRIVQDNADGKRAVMNAYRRGLINDTMRQFQLRVLQLPLDKPRENW